MSFVCPERGLITVAVLALNFQMLGRAENSTPASKNLARAQHPPHLGCLPSVTLKMVQLTDPCVLQKMRLKLNTLGLGLPGVKKWAEIGKDWITQLSQAVSARIESNPRSCLVAFLLLSELLTYLPLWNANKTIFRFYDGPFYMVVAKTFYSLTPEQAASFWMMPNIYYACHLPMYPLLIRIFQLLTQNYEIALVLATVFSSVAAVVLFYEVLKKFEWVSFPFWTAFLFCLLPPRWLIYKAVGATEPLFFCWIFLSFLAWHKRNAWALMLFIMGASLTRITGVLMGPIFFVLFMLEKKYRKGLILCFSALGLVALFSYYQYQLGDFFAYFTFNLGTAKLIQFPAFKAFLASLQDANHLSAESYLFTYGIAFFGTVSLWKKRELFVFCSVYFGFTVFIFHLDISRYMLTIAPFAILVAYDPFLKLKSVRWGVLALSPLMLIYAWRYIPLNTMPLDWYSKLLNFLNT